MLISMIMQARKVMKKIVGLTFQKYVVEFFFNILYINNWGEYFSITGQGIVLYCYNLIKIVFM